MEFRFESCIAIKGIPYISISELISELEVRQPKSVDDIKQILYIVFDKCSREIITKAQQPPSPH